MNEILSLFGHAHHPVNEKHPLVTSHRPVAGEMRDMLGVQLQSECKRDWRHADVARLRRASWAFTTRRVPLEVAYSTSLSGGSPRAGDLVLAKIDVLGHHGGLQLATGRRRTMFAGDEIVVVYGNRYASNQFESLVPDTLGPCHLVAGGGIASRALSWHCRIAKGPTHITPIGLLLDAKGERVNLRNFALPPIDKLGDTPTTVAVVGTGMDSGKTQSAAYLVRGLIAAGLRVGYAKVTGTGAGGDTWLLKDAGAFPVLDFTDAGMATTYMLAPSEVDRVLTTLIGHISNEGVDAMVLEIADGVFQRETSALLQSAVFHRLIQGIVLTSGDSMGAAAGVNWLKIQPVPVLALSGILSAAPLQAKEAILAVGLPVYNREQLSDASVALDILGRTQHAARLEIEKHNQQERQQWI
jgi:hypothetical protein